MPVPALHPQSHLLVREPSIPPVLISPQTGRSCWFTYLSCFPKPIPPLKIDGPVKSPSILPNNFPTFRNG